jgi:large subunit ribosomal protein L13
VETLSYRTQSAKKETVVRNWWVVDAEGQTLGRMATKIATILRGKHKASYSPHVDCGDNVIVINAEKIALSGRKMDNKVYLTYSGYPGGQKSATAGEILAKKPEQLVEMAVRGMLPKGKLGRSLNKKLYVYKGGEHRHAAQKPKTLTITK